MIVMLSFCLIEETRGWNEFVKMDQAEKRGDVQPTHPWHYVNAWLKAHLEKQGTKMNFDSINVDYWPSLRVKGFYLVEAPAAWIVGWYQNPPYYGYIAPVSLLSLPLVSSLPLLPRVIVLNCFMLLVVALQWLWIGRWMERKKSIAIAVPIWLITAIGIVSAGIGIVLQRVPDDIYLYLGGLMLLCLICWAWIGIAAVVYALKMRAARKYSGT
jgi:hypothetical protein